MLTGVVLCRNEAAVLPRCLSSLSFCDQTIVIDDSSQDNSVQVAKKYTDQVLSHPLNNDFSAQRNYALSLINSGWVLFVDADEEVPKQLAEEILQILNRPQAWGYYLHRTDWQWGRQLRYGDLRQSKFIRLAHKDHGSWQGKVHETWMIQGSVGVLSKPLLHYPHPSLFAFIHSLNEYSSIRAQELFQQKIRTNIFQVIVFPILKFFHLYINKLGVLDGTAGFIHALCMSFYTFLVRGKLFLMYKKIGEYA